MIRACSVDSCPGKYCAKGYCKKHYNRVRRHGDVNVHRVYKRGPENANYKHFTLSGVVTTKQLREQAQNIKFL